MINYQINNNYDKFRISEVLMTVYKLIWDDFCSTYLEIIKPEYLKPIDKISLKATFVYFEDILKLLHPFMPFISEEIWSLISERSTKENLIIAKWPKVNPINNPIIVDQEFAALVISGIRTIRNYFYLFL